MRLQFGKFLVSLLCAFCLLISFSAQASAVLTPLNDDTMFVKQVYQDFLNRAPDADGLAYWAGEISDGNMTRTQMVEQYLVSAEFGETISPVVRLYFTYYSRIPDYDGLMFWVNSYAAGMSLNDISDAFATAQEFIDIYGALSNEEFISQMYINVYGRQPDAEGLAYWSGVLDTAVLTRGQVMVEFSSAEEYLSISANQVYVTMTYMGMLRRAPDQDGFDFWVDSMDQGVSGLGLIDLFLNSDEYEARFNIGLSVTGQFIDSFVAGLNYECSSGQRGTTNVNGEFTCLEGETVTFYLGNYLLGSSDVKEKVTPYDLYPYDESAAVNIAQLLQTLDENNDPSDGIVIPGNFTALDNITTSPEADAFEQDMEVELGRTLIDEMIAKAHLDTDVTGKPSIPGAYLQWRNYEDSSLNRIRGWLTLPQGMTLENVSDLNLKNSSGAVIASFESFRGSPDNYLMYDCRVGECTSKITHEYGYSVYLPAHTLAGTYTYVLTDVLGEVYKRSVVYQGQIELPVVASNSIVPEWDTGGNLTIEWVNLINDPSWELFDQVRVNVNAGTGTAETIIVKLTPQQPSNITIPSSVIDSVFDDIDRSWIHVHIQTRAYDDNGSNYARGLSETVQLRPVIYPVRFRPINEVGTGVNNHRLSDAYSAVDFLTINADISDPLGVTFTYETRADFQIASTGMVGGYFALGMFFDLNGNDEFDAEASIQISQDLSTSLFGCSASHQYTARQEWSFVSVTVPWSDLNSCGIYQDTPVRFWGHYHDETTSQQVQFP